QIGLDAWIIQDGNYPDFEVGQEYRFGLEFHPDRLAAASGDYFLLESTGRVRYRVQAQVVWHPVDRAEPAWVIDFGFLAYQSTAPPKFAVVGSWVTGEIYLAIDHFSYFERLSRLPGAPALIYPWYIHRIWLEMTPWLRKTDPTGGEMMLRDRKR